MAPPRPYEKSAVPAAAKPATVEPQWSLGLIETKHLGNREYTLVAYEITGDKCKQHILPDGSYPRLEDALMDMRRAATQGWRFRKWANLLSGRGF